MKKMGRPKSDNAKKKVLSIRVPDQLYSQRGTDEGPAAKV